MSRAVRGEIKGSQTIDRERFLERAVGECHKVTIQINGVSTKCLLDTGSQVSTLSESFFKKHLLGKEEDVLPTAKWLKLTAANSLPIPYLGYVELDVEAMGLNIPECGFLIVKDNVLGKEEVSSSITDQETVGLIGMNIVKRCKQLVTVEFDTTLRSEHFSGYRPVRRYK